MRAYNAPFNAAFAHLAPNIDANEAPVNLTPDTVEKSRRQLAVGGSILPRRAFDE